MLNQKKSLFIWDLVLGESSNKKCERFSWLCVSHKHEKRTGERQAARGRRSCSSCGNLALHVAESMCAFWPSSTAVRSLMPPEAFLSPPATMYKNFLLPKSCHSSGQQMRCDRLYSLSMPPQWRGPRSMLFSFCAQAVRHNSPTAIIIKIFFIMILFLSVITQSGSASTLCRPSP